MSNCYRCGYFREEKRPDGSIRNYCNDRDCTVDPYDKEIYDYTIKNNVVGYIYDW